MFELNTDGTRAIMPSNDIDEYDDGEYIVTDNQEILDKLSESE